MEKKKKNNEENTTKQKPGKNFKAPTNNGSVHLFPGKCMCKGCITCIYCSSQLFIFHHNLKHRNYALSLNRNQFFFFLLKPVGLRNL